MIFIFRFLCGFLLAELSGETPEKLLNLAAQHRITLWGLHRKNGKLCVFLTVKSFRKIRKIRRNTKIKLHITKKIGLPFLMYPYRLRYGLFIGGALSLATLMILSNFIWTFEINGNQKTSNKEIFSACKELGIHYGIPKAKINSRADAQKLILACPNLSWASLNVEGAVLTINISEQKSNKINGKEPCNLIASEDGIVKKIDVLCGTPNVAVGDTVHRGEILVSGITEIGEQTVFCRAEGSVLASARITYKEDFAFCQTVEKKQNKTVNRKVLSVFGYPIPLFVGKVQGDCRLSSTSKPLVLFQKPLPIVLINGKYEKLKHITQKYTSEDAEKKCIQLLKKRIKNDGIESYTVKEKKAVKSPDSVTVSLVIETEKNIAKNETILFDMIN